VSEDVPISCLCHAEVCKKVMNGIKRNFDAWNICFKDCIKRPEVNMENTVSQNRIKSTMYDMYFFR
jgi:hypothetical protein